MCLFLNECSLFVSIYILWQQTFCLRFVSTSKHSMYMDVSILLVYVKYITWFFSGTIVYTENTFSTVSHFCNHRLSSKTKALVIPPKNSLIHCLFYIAQCPNTWFKELSHITCIRIMEGNDKNFRSINMWCIK